MDSKKSCKIREEIIEKFNKEEDEISKFDLYYLIGFLKCKIDWMDWKERKDANELNSEQEKGK